MESIVCYDYSGTPLKNLYQWDSNQKIMISGVDVASSTEVHFCHPDSSEALVLTPYADEENIVSTIPNILLQQAKPLIVYVFQDSGESGSRTVNSVRIPVYPRPKPADYIYTETEVLCYREIDERLRALEVGGVTGGYYTPEVTQPDENTLQFSFTASSQNMPVVDPVNVTLPGNSSNDSTQNPDGLTTELKNALVNYFTHVMPQFDDSNGLTHVNAILTALGAETRTEPETEKPEATLSSISAVYSGGDVAVGTAVSALTGIVVTATYSDGSTETVTDYTLSGTIAEGSNTVTVTYEGMTTTFTVTGVAESGGEEDPDPVTYSITNNLTNVTSSNTAASVTENTAYTATLTAADGYVLDTVTVTMGGVDVTATVYADGVVNIAAVTGNVVITATAVVESTGDDTAGTDWEDGVAYTPTWTENHFMNGPWSQAFEDYAVTGYLPCNGASTISWASGIEGGYQYNSFFDADKTYISKFAVSAQTNWEVTVPENAAYFRTTKTMTAADPVITPHA